MSPDTVSTNSGRSVMRRVVAKIITKVFVGFGVLTFAGCMSSVGPTVHATKQLSNYSIAAIEKLDLPNDVLADAMSIQLTVSDAKPFNLAAATDGVMAQSAPLLWQNDVTGSHGEVSYLSEKSSGNEVCRHFKSTRLSFEGVSSYKGVSCKTGNGGWTLQSFFPVTS